MAVDGIKPKVASTIAPPTIEPKKIEEAKLEKAFEPIAKKASEGFDTLKKKLVSVTGGYKAHKPMISERDDLKASISGQRSAMAANGGAAAPARAAKISDDDGPAKLDGTLKTASSKGADPAPRTDASDFAKQAAATPGIKPADVDATANAAARAALEKDFGVKVKDGDKKWSTEELSRAHESFATMPKADQEKLKGLDLIRDGKASAKSQAEMGNKGTVAGEYSPNTDSTNGKRDKPGSIAIYDAAFPAGKNSRKESMHVILHEAGHAVEGRARDDAAAASNIAADKQNAANDVLTPAAKANSEGWGVADKSGYPFGSTNRAMTDFGQVKLNDKPGMAFLNAQGAVSNAIGKLQDAKTPADIAKAQTALDTAKAKRDTAMKGMSGHGSESKASDWIAATDKQEKLSRTYADANSVYLPAKKDADAKMTDLKAVATVTTEDGKIKTSSKEIAAFTKARGKEGEVSGYGASKGAEGYAEAYALYQRDPKTMKQDFPNQYKFFHAKHKNAAD